ncbi:MAG: hypothetical protein E6R03_17165 [Hyphomicrobiaceae bacterium]|nr:MAG: hypothetical protein E6R03_17165 [Hyphomicrobiaceae bacterium]
MFILNSFARITIALIAIAIWTSAALAQTTITVPYGQWLADYVIPVAGFALIVLVILAIGYVIKLLPPWAQTLVETQFRDHLVKLAADAINAGVQATKNAVFEQELSINVGNEAIAKAAQAFIDTAPKDAVAKLGGVEGVTKWLLTQAESRGLIINGATSTDEILNSPDVRAVIASNPS